jgi:hypothetical protein
MYISLKSALLCGRLFAYGKKEKSGIRALQMPDQSVCFTMFFHGQNTVSVLDRIRSLLDDK